MFKDEKDEAYQVSKGIAGIGYDPWSPKELMFYRDKFAKENGEEPWYEVSWQNLG